MFICNLHFYWGKHCEILTTQHTMSYVITTFTNILLNLYKHSMGSPGSALKESTCKCSMTTLVPGWEDPWRTKWQPFQYSCLKLWTEEPEGYSPRGLQEPDTTTKHRNLI